MVSMSPTTVTLVGALTNVILAALKVSRVIHEPSPQLTFAHPLCQVSIGGAAGSAALIADGWHSFGDLVSDVVCWALHKVGAAGPNGSRYEVVGTLVVALLLATSGVAMAMTSGVAALGALRSPAALARATGATFALADLAALGVAVASVSPQGLDPAGLPCAWCYASLVYRAPTGTVPS